MSITSANPNITIDTAAKDGTLGSQAAAAANEIIFDTTITAVNNGDLIGSPTLDGRKVIIRQGAAHQLPCEKNMANGTRSQVALREVSPYVAYGDIVNKTTETVHPTPLAPMQ